MPLKREARILNLFRYLRGTSNYQPRAFVSQKPDVLTTDEERPEGPRNQYI